MQTMHYTTTRFSRPSVSTSVKQHQGVDVDPETLRQLCSHSAQALHTLPEICKQQLDPEHIKMARQLGGFWRIIPWVLAGWLTFRKSGRR
jgi:hypothetical protein